MKIVIAPNALKGSLSAHSAARAMEQGARRALRTVDVTLAPVADGGDGFAAILADAAQATKSNISVKGPLGNTIDTAIYINSGNGLAIIEMATIAGITLVPPAARNPLLTTSFGVGEAMKIALDAGANKLIIGIGGSATNDAGIGMATALGARFLNNNNEAIEPIGRSLSEIVSIDISGIDKRLRDVTIDVACDVDNPLFGENGAAHIFATQKGATPEQVLQLDNGLRHFATTLNKTLNIDISNIPGSGAAGGLGGALMAFCGGILSPGIDIVLDTIDFNRKLKNADLVLTAEGQIDSQTGHGKAPAGVARRAFLYGIPCIVLAGSVEISETLISDQSDFTAAFSLCPGPIVLETAMNHAFDYLSRATEQVVRVFAAGQGSMRIPVEKSELN